MGPSVPSGGPGISRFPRRTALKAALGVGLAGLGVPALNGCSMDNAALNLTVAGGEPGGFYREFSTLLADSLQRHGVAGKVEALPTGGSLENMERLLAGKATFAVALADAAVEEAAVQNAAGGSGRLVALGKVYENYVHCIVRRDGGIASFTDLAGRSVAIGAAGSGTSFTAHRMIGKAGLGGSIREHLLGLNTGLESLEKGSVEALLWSGGVPTSAIAELNGRLGLRFLDLSALIPGMRATYNALYDSVLIPDNSYEGVPAVGTIGVPNLLLCRSDLDAGTVTRTVELLVNHAAELVPRSSLGVQFLSRETLINTAGIPLHPAAAAAYRALHG